MAAKSAFTAAEQEIRELFGDYLEDSCNGAVLVLSETTALPVVRNALEKSFAALGFGDSACLYATLYPNMGAGGGAPLGPGAGASVGADAPLGPGASADLGAGAGDGAGAGTPPATSAGEGETKSNLSTNTGARLDPQAAFLLLEGIDSPFAICTDNAAAQLLEATYKTQLPRNAATHVFGRAAVIFNDLSALLSTEKGKRATWELLKALVN